VGWGEKAKKTQDTPIIEDSQCLCLRTRVSFPGIGNKEGETRVLMYPCSFKTKAGLKAPTEEGFFHVLSEQTDTRPTLIT
jgi:hypothetical protein